MNAEHRARKQAIRSFMQNHYTDERLAMLLAHAQSGRLDFYSCCCFIGIPTADHALRGKGTFSVFSHIESARALANAAQAERAYGTLAGDTFDIFYDHSVEANQKTPPHPHPHDSR